MNKILLFILVLLVSSNAIAQAVGHIDKKTKEFNIPSNPKAEYRIFGYQFANVSTRKMICFSTHTGDVHDNYNNCPLGSYFDTNSMKEGDRIVYLGMVGNFGKMNFISGSGKKTIFYLPKTSFIFK